MSKFYSTDLIHEIKNRIKLSDIIGKRFDLIYKGSVSVGLCPFHSEKTPSFKVEDDKGFYYCFGCHETGDIFSFLQKSENLSFREAVEKAADLAGVRKEVLNEKEAQEYKFKEQINTLNTMVSRLCESELFRHGGKNYLQYLENRGITEEAINKFKLGCCPSRLSNSILLERFNEIIKHLSSQYPAGELIKNYLKQEPTKALRNRVIFPIYDENDKLVGFSGRAIDEKTQPKYKNSAEDTIFKKRNLLYGFNLRDPQNKTAFLVEGYLDVIAMWQEDFKNVFSPMGTALSDEQAKLLLNRFDEIYLCFDGDEAGFKGMQRAAKVLLPLLKPGKELFFVLLPTGKDPHQLCTSGDSSILADLIDRPLDLVDFLYEFEYRNIPHHTPSQRALIKQNVLKILELIENKELKYLYKKELYEICKQSTTTPRIPKQRLEHYPLSNRELVEVMVLKALLLCPSIYPLLSDLLYRISFSTQMQNILTQIDSYLDIDPEIRSQFLIHKLKHDFPMTNFDLILSDAINVHAPFLNSVSDRDALRREIEYLLIQYGQSQVNIVEDLVNAKEECKKVLSSENWERFRKLWNI
jgi:DNA primase